MSQYQRHEAEKARWLRLNPAANPDQVEQAFRAVARKLSL